jgi:hypothetical protein
MDDNFSNLNSAKLENIVEDTTPQLGGNLDAQNNDITGVDELGADAIQLDTAAAETAAAGKLFWNATDGTLDIGLGYGGVVLQTGQETLYIVRNSTGSTIDNGTAVYCSGVTAGSGRMEASPMTGNGSVPPVRFLGLATQDITTGVNGVITHFGYVRDIDTRGTEETAFSVGDEDWAVGDRLWVHPTAAGKLTKVEPDAPNSKICVAVVIVRHQTTGKLFVRPTSNLSLSDHQDVYIPTTPTDGQVLTWDNSNSRWNAESVPAGGISNVVEDTSPQLGGNLDVNGNSITSASNANVEIAPNGTGDVYLTADTIRVGDSNTDATLSTYGTGDLILTTNEGAANQGSIRIYDGANSNINLTPHGTGVVVLAGGTQVSSTAIDVGNTITTTFLGNVAVSGSSFNIANSVSFTSYGPSFTVQPSDLNIYYKGLFNTFGVDFIPVVYFQGLPEKTVYLSAQNASNIPTTELALDPAGNLTLTSFYGSIKLNNSASGKVYFGNGANTAVMSSAGAAALVLETNDGSNSGNITINPGLGGNVAITHGATGRVTVGNFAFANTAIISSSGSQSLTLNTNSGNTASVVLQSGPSAEIRLETGLAGKVTLGNQFFGNTAILSSSGTQSLTLNTSSGNTASVILQSGPSANIQLQTGFAGRVTIGNQFFGNTAILSSSGSQSLTLSTSAGNTGSVILQSGPTGNVVLETALAGKVVITNQLLGDASVLSSNDTAPLSLQSVASDVNIEPGSMIINHKGLFNTFGLSYIPVTYIQGNPDQIVYLSSMNASNIPVVEIGLDPAGTMTLTAATVKSPNLIQSNKVFSYGNSGTLTWAPNIATNGNIQTITLTGNLTLNAFTSPVSGQWVRLIITQDGTGSRTLTSSMKFEGGSKTLSTAANAVDIIDVWYIGTTYYASLTKGYA